MADQFKYQPEWQGPLSGRSFEKQTEDAINRALASGTANASDATPLQAGVASPGTSDEWSRGDHIHPPQAEVAGNAATATRLQNTRSIRLTGDASGVAPFNGTGDANIAVSIPQATTSAKGLMSSADKTKLDSVEADANNYTLPQATTATLGGVRVDALIDGNSTNPVRNSAVKAAFDSLQGQISQCVKLAGNQIVAGSKTFTSDINGQLNGNAKSSSRLATGRYIGLSGAVSAQAQVFTGESDISIPVSYLDAAKLTGIAPVNTTGNAATASKLATAQKLKVALGSTTDATFDGSAAQENIPVSGTLPVSNGGTGSSTKNFCDLSTDQGIGGKKTFSGEWLSLTPTTDNRSRFFATPVPASFSTRLAQESFAATDHGAMIELYAKTSPDSTAGQFLLYATDSVQSKLLAGKPDGTLTWNGQPIQTTSDERVKTAAAAVPDSVLEAWGKVQWGQFQYRDAVAAKGEKARLHLGLIAQRVKSAFEEQGLDVCAYGILCHEEKKASTLTFAGETENVEPVDLWMVRYVEAQAMEACYQRWRADRAEARMEELAQRLAALEEKAG